MAIFNSYASLPGRVIPKKHRRWTEGKTRIVLEKHGKTDVSHLRRLHGWLKAIDGELLLHGSLNVPIEHHPTIRYMVYNGYYKVMSNIPKMGQLPTPVLKLDNPNIELNGWCWPIITVAGCWSSYPSEKWWSESQLGWWHSQWKVIKFMYQTTNQLVTIQ